KTGRSAALGRLVGKSKAATAERATIARKVADMRATGERIRGKQQAEVDRRVADMRATGERIVAKQAGAAKEGRKAALGRLIGKSKVATAGELLIQAKENRGIGQPRKYEKRADGRTTPEVAANRAKAAAAFKGARKTIRENSPALEAK